MSKNTGAVLGSQILFCITHELFLFVITMKKIQEIKVPCVKMDSMEEFGSLDSPEFENIFVVTDFQKSVFNDLYKADCRIVGPPVILNCAQMGEVRNTRLSAQEYIFINVFFES